jgi:hypothetical protein
MAQGPNVKRLITHKMSLIMVPAGSKDGLAAALNSLTRPGGIGDAAKEATAWVEQAIAAVKAAPDNPYGDDDEAIAGEILRGIWKKQGGTTCPTCGGQRYHTRLKGYRCPRCD